MERVARWGWILVGGVFGAMGWAGCAAPRQVDPVGIHNPKLGPMAVAVAPALNLSGGTDFDVDRFADLMASELGHADGITVIPVSRVLGVLAAQGTKSIESQAHALEVVRLLGADAILVFSVTEYDPYVPPRIAISAQLFGRRPVQGGGALDPAALSRRPGLASSPAPYEGRRGLLAATQRAFDASHNSVVAEVREFAGKRRGDRSPYGWRRYIVSQQDFVRFCCHSIIRAILRGDYKAEAAETTHSE